MEVLLTLDLDAIRSALNQYHFGQSFGYAAKDLHATQKEGLLGYSYAAVQSLAVILVRKDLHATTECQDSTLSALPTHLSVKVDVPMDLSTSRQTMV